MVESQVRPNGITDRRIIDAMGEIAREDFVPGAQKPLAYMDADVALLPGRTKRHLIAAMAFARLAQLAEIKSTDKVLHVGAATGYGTAVLARLAAFVVAVESDAILAAAARANLGHLGNVSIVEGALADGAASMAPFDVIFIEGRIGEMPQSLGAQLGEDGRIVAAAGDSVGRAHLWIRHGTTLACRKAFDTSIATLPGFEKNKASFVFEGFNDSGVR
ncbi:MAG: protein-L-isoaspartate O-methyltransferase family protein [Aestuariivirga sp.]